MKHSTLFILVLLLMSCANAENKIDRKAVVNRHTIHTTASNPNSPAQVGNGKFAFGVDITGLQSFVPFNTMSDWGWHSFPIPEGYSPEDFKGEIIETHGRPVAYPIQNTEQPELSRWLEGNPHRINLGRIGFILLNPDGSNANEEDLTNTNQKIDLWTGIISSNFELDGKEVKVQTSCHPEYDMIGIDIESDLMNEGRIQIIFDFPYADHNSQVNYVGNYSDPSAHTSILEIVSSSSVLITRKMDDLNYFVSVNWDGDAVFKRESNNNHRFYLNPNSSKLSFTCHYEKEKKQEKIIPTGEIKSISSNEWGKYWQSGAAIDLSGSTDERWKELERRIILSQYVMRVNEAGLYPPQESGLVNNGWYGRFHFEMIWWHGVHYGLWNRWDLADRYLSVYQDFLPTSIERAKKQGYKGARWPKCTADIDREWPHPIHATLIWQQPHPIYFAEMDYRLHPTPETLDKWKDIVFNTADFMADYAFYDEDKKEYVLGPPVYIVSENTDMLTTQNPAFELAYWRYGLRVALEWCKRLSVPENEKWKDVLEKLSPLPVQDGLYVTHEGIKDMWTKYNFEHPALIGTYGMLPGDGVDNEIFVNTLNKVTSVWNFDHTWGWDFPMLAMAAARTGNTELAIDFLLHDAHGFQFDEHGLCTGGPFPYFPSNGGLLTAIAMMCAGWDESEGNYPGFPKNGEWVVSAEGFVKIQ